MTRAWAAGLLATLVGATGCAPVGGFSAATPAWVSATTSIEPGAPAHPTVRQHYASVAARILATARADRGAYQRLSELTDGIGPRITGSPAFDRAIAWAVSTLTAEGFVVRTEPVMVPHWVRGAEDAGIVSSALAREGAPGVSERPLRVIGLGGSVATPAGGVKAPVVVVTSWDELEAKAAQVKGAIVLFDVAMPPWDAVHHNSHYGELVRYRTQGPSRAAKLGAVATLVRSVSATSLATLHTGALDYDPAQPKIAAAALTGEDASLLARLAARGPLVVRLHLESQRLPDAPAANVIAELPGSEHPEEIIVLGAHLDSWDVGQGAQDDGAGCVIMMEALTVLKRMGLQPKRTIRVVLYAGEEYLAHGAAAYAKAHAAELPNTVMAIESDSGGFAPVGFSIDEALSPEVQATLATNLQIVVDLLRPLGSLIVQPGYSGTDIDPMVPAGVPALGLMVDSAHYFDIHHSDADTLDKVSPSDLADSTAAVAVLAYFAADLPARLGAPLATP